MAAQSIHDETVANLEQMLATFQERNRQYGENYLTLGKVMVALFPDGITLKTEEDFIRFHFMDWMMGKMTRFVCTGMTHVDSIHDASVYGAMLTAFLKVHLDVNQSESK